MCEIMLKRPTVEYADDIMTYRQEFLDRGDSMDGCGNLRKCSTAQEWIEHLVKCENPASCPEDKVPSDTYIAVRLSDNKIVGVIQFRHHIDHPVLGLWGGHIGYSVRPNERRKGYATEMLCQVLEKVRNFGLDKVMITCDCDNIASEKAIIANGGLFEKQVEVDGEIIKRYWIVL